MSRESRPFGLWDSPVSADDAGGTGLSAPAFDSDGRTLAWLERRGDESVILCRRQGEAAPVELTRGHAVRARVFYGGGEFAVARGRVVFVEDGDHLSAVPLDGGGVSRLTPAFGHPAAPAPSPDGRWIAYVHGDGATDRLAVVDAWGRNWPQSLVEGADFYMQPAWHPRGRQLAWVEYDLPEMPWDSSRLVVGRLRFPAGAAPVLADRRRIAGGDGHAVCQPEFSPDGRWLAWAGDEGGFSQLWLQDLASGDRTCLTPDEAGDVALPAWVQGVRVLAFSGDGRRLWFARSHLGRRSLFACDLPGGRPQLFEPLADCTSVTHVAAAPRGDRIAVAASSPRQPQRICSARRRGGGWEITVQARSSAERLEAADLSTPLPARWAAADGAEVHGLYYPPASRRFEGTGPPPLIVDVHGGPTAQADLRLPAGGPVLRHAGLGGAAPQLPGKHRLRAGLHDRPPRRVGRPRRGGRRGRGPPPGRRRAGRPAAPRRLRGQRRRLHRPARPHPAPRDSSPPVSAATASPTCWPWPARPTSSSPATPTPSSAPCRRRPASTASAPPCSPPRRFATR